MSATRSTMPRTLFRAALVALALAAPLTAISAFGDDEGRSIESSTSKRSGAGLVLMVALQRG